jgi:Na+-driven multidrug efflux pump
MSNAAATLVGQNLGANQPARAEKSVWVTAKYNAIFMALVSIFFLFAGGAMVHFINRDEGVRAVAIKALNIISLGYIFYGVGMVLTNAFNGAGDTRTPTLISLFCFWTFQIPIAYLMAIPLRMGPQGVFYAIIIAETAITVCAFILFRKGKWKQMKI